MYFLKRLVYKNFDTEVGEHWGKDVCFEPFCLNKQACFVGVLLLFCLVMCVPGWEVFEPSIGSWFQQQNYIGCGLWRWSTWTYLCDLCSRRSIRFGGWTTEEDQSAVEDDFGFGSSKCFASSSKNWENHREIRLCHWSSCSSFARVSSDGKKKFARKTAKNWWTLSSAIRQSRHSRLWHPLFERWWHAGWNGWVRAAAAGAKSHKAGQVDPRFPRIPRFDLLPDWESYKDGAAKNDAFMLLLKSSQVYLTLTLLAVALSHEIISARTICQAAESHRDCRKNEKEMAWL